MCFTYHQHKAVLLNTLEGQHIKLDIVGVGPYFRSLNFHNLKEWDWTKQVGKHGRASFPRQAKFAESSVTVVALKKLQVQESRALHRFVQMYWFMLKTCM